MRKLCYISTILFALFTFSCESNLDVKPVASIDAEDAITNEAGLNAALLGLYDAFQSDSYYGRDLYILQELSANDAVRKGTSLEYDQFANHSILSDNASIESLWTAAYIAINNANNIIERAEGIEMDEATKQNIVGEALFLRALAHFDLLKLFGGIPYKLQSTREVSDNINAPRETKEENYTQLLSDLSEAKEKITLNKGKGFVSPMAVDALLARVELYYASYLNSETISANNADRTHYQKAYDYAEALIQNTEFGLLEEYAQVFTVTENKEIIFQLNYSIQDRNRMAYYLSPVTLGGRGEVAYSTSLANAYKKADETRDDFIFQDFPTLDQSGTATRVAKYQDAASGADPIIVFRLAEMYLIQAEALYMLEGNAAEERIRELLNKVRARSANELTALGSNPLSTILDERRLELCFEGHRWADLVRTKTASNKLGISQDATLYPIPLIEIQTNTAINAADQNSGY